MIKRFLHTRAAAALLGLTVAGLLASTVRCAAAGTAAVQTSANIPSPTPGPATNQDDVATITLGEERPGDRITHLVRERDGRTTVRTLDGVLCRYLNRKEEKKFFGYLYFLIDPEFKQEDLSSARIELECLVQKPTIIRLQYDAMEGDKPKPYKSVLATNRDVSGPRSEVPFSQLLGSNSWQKVTFEVRNAVFMNSQNGGADFRFEVGPAEIYIRRVTVTRTRGISPGTKQEPERRSPSP